MDTNAPSAAQPQPKRSARLPTRSRREGKTVWASPQALAWGAPLRLGTAALQGFRKLRLGTAAFRGPAVPPDFPLPFHCAPLRLGTAALR
jgi:hypothetical protein